MRARARAIFVLLALAWLALGVWRAPRIVAFLENPDFERIVALAAWLIAGCVLTGLLWRAVRKRGADRERRARPPSRLDARTRPVLAFLALAALVALLAPLLAPLDPYVVPGDLLAARYLPPASTLHVVGDRRGGEVFARSFRIDGEEIVLERSDDPRVPPRRLAIESLGEPRRGWRTLPPGGRVGRLDLGDREVPYRRVFHLLGTDDLGRDLLSRIIYGSRVSLAVGLLAMLLAVGLGTLVGCAAGYGSEAVDAIARRTIDVLLSFPRLLLIILVLALWREAGLFTVVVLLGLTGWMSVARLVRAEIRRLRALELTDAARALGASASRVLFRHLLPLATTPILVAATLRVADAILLEAALSFLGLGVEPPTATWGSIVNDGRTRLADAWWISTFAGLAIVVTVLAFHSLGDALRRSLDPRATWRA